MSILRPYSRVAPDITVNGKVIPNPYIAYDPQGYRNQRYEPQLTVRGAYPGYKKPELPASGLGADSVVTGTDLLKIGAVAGATVFALWLGYKFMTQSDEKEEAQIERQRHLATITLPPRFIRRRY